MQVSDNIMVINTLPKAKLALATNVRERRLAMSLTQAGLSKRSGVALATLRKFEQTGSVSVDNLFSLMLVVGGLEEVIAASRVSAPEFASIDDVLADTAPPKRKRGSRS